MTCPDLATRWAAGPEIVLDLSRLMSRVLRATPTGIDRVELAYAMTLLDAVPQRLSFGGRFPRGIYGRLERNAVLRFLANTAALWRQRDRIGEGTLRLTAVRQLIALRPRPIPPRKGARVFLQVSPHHLEKQERTARILRREDAQFVVMVHDLIPIEHPEYARPDGAAQHRRRITTVAELAHGIVANSDATREALLPLLTASRHAPRIAVAHLGSDSADQVTVGDVSPLPYFVCVGTIEARKNHLLLLNVWRRLVETLGAAAPVLHLIGRRGWENEQVVDLLERCRSLQGRVIEHPDMSDRAMRELLAGARAVLLPSFAEGFGMPVAEALSAGVPVIASDIAALREVGQGVPEYLDPIDGPAWVAAVRDYAEPASPRRAAQIARLVGWRAITWQDHLGIVLALIDSLRSPQPALRTISPNDVLTN